MQSITVFNEGIAYLQECLNCYSENTAYLILFAVSALFIIIRGTDEEKEIFIPGAFALIVTVYNPIVPYVLDSFFDVNNEYYRLFWITPVVILVPLVAAKLIEMMKTKASRVMMASFLLVLGMLSGNLVYVEGSSIKQNIYKIPDELIRIDTIIHEDCNSEYPKAFFEYEYNMEIRQYDPTMLLTVDREDYLYAVAQPYTDEMLTSDDKPVYRILAPLVRNQHVDAKVFADALEQTRTEYVVLNSDHPLLNYVEDAGLIRVGETTGHIVYRCNLSEKSDFELIDYSDVEHKFSFRRLK